MAVAPSFEKFTVLSEPYLKANKQYIDVQNPTTGTKRSVRWYSDKEWQKLYGKATLKTSPSDIVDSEGRKLGPWPNLKKARGFINGPITLLKGAPADEDFFRHSSSCWHAEGLGWYVSSTQEVPANLPSTVHTRTLTWEEFHSHKGEEYLRDPQEIARLVAAKFRKTC